MLSIKQLKVSIENKEIIKGVSLEIAPGEIHAVMGPNGSGKSTLSYALAGHPKYEIRDGEIRLDEEELTDKTPDERAIRGLYLANQYPVAIPGLIVSSFLWQIYKNKMTRINPEIKKTSLMEFKKWLSTQAEALDLNPELLGRSLNDGFSGGEKKKLEILQMLVLNPKYIILDEIDSGLDVDALKKIATTVDKIAKTNKIGVLVITHYSRILKYLKPNKVHVFKNGVITESGDEELVNKIENEGYKE